MINILAQSVNAVEIIIKVVLLSTVFALLKAVNTKAKAQLIIDINFMVKIKNTGTEKMKLSSHNAWRR